MKKLGAVLLISLLLYLGYHHKALFYGLEQGYGQLKVLFSAVPLDKYLVNHSLSDEQLKKIALIREVKSFAETEIGLKPTDSYQSYYDQGGEPLLWVVTASPEFKLEAHQWKFPIAGSFSYKGFFDHNKALNEAEKLRQSGYDTEVDEVSAWSTLGWFNDPILSSMLEKDSGRLAELIIHELSHASIYLKDSVELNENLAGFIGRKGAELFLESKGATAALEAYKKRQTQREELGKIIRDGAQTLDSLYGTYSDQMKRKEKLALKKEIMHKVRKAVAGFRAGGDSLLAVAYFREFEPNNAYFTGISTYRSKRNYFEKQYRKEFDGNLRRFIEYYREEYGH